MTKIINLIEFRDMNKRSYDGKTTQGSLLKRIRKIVHKVNTTNDTDKEIADFIIKSFSINGIIETYNQLGQYGWYQMILQMAEHEVWERNKHEIRI